jgi:hypothetical protein
MINFTEFGRNQSWSDRGIYTGMCRIAGVPVQFRTKHLLNTSLEHHDYTKLFYAVLALLRVYLTPGSISGPETGFIMS